MPGAVKIQMKVLGETQINRRMLRWAARASDNAPAFEEIMTYLEGVEEKQFDSEGASSGNPWAPLKEATRTYKEQHNLDPRILHATLALRRSLVEHSDEEAIRIITPTMMVFGTTVPYGIIHQKHFDPIRRPIDLTEVQKVAILKILQLWISRGIARGVRA